MKQQNLNKIRNYNEQPRSNHEPRDQAFKATLEFTQSDYDANPTKQSEADACDINNIMKRYEATGFLPDSSGRVPQFGDFSTMTTFQEALEIVASAQSSFFALPALIRAKFENDPAKFLGYVEQAYTDPGVAEDLVKMGLAVERPETPAKVLQDIRENTKIKKPQPDSTASKGE